MLYPRRRPDYPAGSLQYFVCTLPGFVRPQLGERPVVWHRAISKRWPPVDSRHLPLRRH